MTTFQNFGLTVLKLKRDTLKTNSVLEIVIDKNSINETHISFNKRNNSFVIKSSILTNDNWNPPISEFKDFIDSNFIEEDLLDAIANYNALVFAVFSNENASMLFEKTKQILELLKFEENLGKVLTLNNIEFSYFPNFKQFSVVSMQNSKTSLLTDELLNSILKRASYMVISEQLNTCFISLNRKK